MPAVEVYGIKTCDTVRRARDWLDAKAVAYRFHDFKAEGADSERLKDWADQVGWEVLINRSGTTFRKLPESQKIGLDRDGAIALMRQQPSMIKRPVLEAGGALLVGFDPERYAALLVSGETAG